MIKNSSRKNKNINVSKHSSNKLDKKTKIIYYTVFILAVLCLMLSILIVSEKKYYETGEKGLCTIITEGNGCQIVQTSKYSELFGFKNPYLGIFGFSILALAAISYILINNYWWLKHTVILGSIGAGSLAIYFLYVQAFILTIYCIFCVIVDIMSLILLGISIYLIYKTIKK